MSGRGSASERIAEEVLKALGFEVKERRKKVEVEGHQVAEIDLVLEPPKKKIAVEVKAGKVDISAVRQAYANAKLLDAIPMVVGSGWANDEARALAEALGVKYLMFEDLFVSDKEELYQAVRTAVSDALSKLLNSLEPSEEACLLAESSSFEELASRVGRERAREIVKRFGKIGNWEAVKAAAKLSCLLWRARGGER